MKKVHLGLCSIVKVINSQKRKIDTSAVKQLGISILLEIAESFSWAAASPSIHRILGHSWERIELNGGYGLGDISEEGLEALDKFI